MGTSVVRELTAEERARMVEARQEMAQAGAQGCSTRFNFLAAFDGTNNDEDNLKLSGTKLSTNVSQLRTQARVANSDSLKSGYYPGVGTGGDQGGLVNAAVLPTPAIQAAAKMRTGSSAWRHWTTSDRTPTPPRPTSARPPPVSVGVVPRPSALPSWCMSAA